MSSVRNRDTRYNDARRLFDLIVDESSLTIISEINMVNLSRVCQLHEYVELHYEVTRYVAQLWIRDGRYYVLEGVGEDMGDAILNLDSQVEKLTIEEVRCLPAMPKSEEGAGLLWY